MYPPEHKAGKTRPLGLLPGCGAVRDRPPRRLGAAQPDLSPVHSAGVQLLERLPGGLLAGDSPGTGDLPLWSLARVGLDTEHGHQGKWGRPHCKFHPVMFTKMGKDRGNQIFSEFVSVPGRGDGACMWGPECDLSLALS